jgi:hypothetical protein
MDTATIIRAINNLPGPARDELLGRISQMVVEALAEGRGGTGQRGQARDTNGSRRGAAVATGSKRKMRVGRATEEEVLAHIKGNPDQRTEQIAAALGSDVKPALKKLRATKLIRTKGQKRAMTYSASSGKG